MRRSAEVGTPSPLVTSDTSAFGTWHVDVPPDLAHAFEDQVEAVHVGLGHAPAARVHRQPTVGALDRTVVGERTALAAPAEAVPLE